MGESKRRTDSDRGGERETDRQTEADGQIQRERLRETDTDRQRQERCGHSDGQTETE